VSPFLLHVCSRVLDKLLISLHVFALAAYTVIMTGFAVGKTFAIHLQAEGFLAGAP
jgi:allophanate hydrolase subunit 1